jgi:diacylglycerol kinase family enzyme
MDAVTASLQQGGHRVSLRPTSAPGHAAELAREAVRQGADLILVAGGDGTVNEAANGMIHSGTPLGVLPAGTANVLAMEMRLGGNAVKAARRLSEMTPVRIGVGLLCETDGTPRRHFLLMAGAGLDAHIVANLNLSLKRMLGKGAYWAAGFSSLIRKLEELDASNGTHRARCSFALASRVRNYGGDLEIALGASLLKEHFEVMLFEGSNPFRYLKYFSGVLLGATARLRGVNVWHTTEIALSPAGREQVHVQIDGEDGGVLPAKLTFVPKALDLLMPPEFVTKEQARWTT